MMDNIEFRVLSEEQFQSIISRLDDISTSTDGTGNVAFGWMNNRELCKILDVSIRTAQNYRDQKLLPFSRIGGKIYYRKSDIDKFLNEHVVC